VIKLSGAQHLTQAELAANLTQKLNAIVDASEVPAWRQRLLRKRAAELQRLEQLRSKGLVWQRVVDTKNQRERTLDSRVLATSPRDDLLRLTDEHARDLRDGVGSLAVDVANDLAWGAAADWLMRCPLDYGAEA
jgi:hypothetical protein